MTQQPAQLPLIRLIVHTMISAITEGGLHPKCTYLCFHTPCCTFEGQTTLMPWKH